MAGRRRLATATMAAGWRIAPSAGAVTPVIPSIILVVIVVRGVSVVVVRVMMLVIGAVRIIVPNRRRSPVVGPEIRVTTADRDTEVRIRDDDASVNPAVIRHDTGRSGQQSDCD
jgi:hypothetical protein